MSLLFNFFNRYQQNNRNFLISLFSGEARFFMKLSREKIVSTEESLVDSLIEAAKLENHDIKIVVFDKASNAIPFPKILQDHRKCDVNNFECTSVDNVHDTAIIAYSSGTTGFPKGVQIFHYSCLMLSFLRIWEFVMSLMDDIGILDHWIIVKVELHD